MTSVILESLFKTFLNVSFREDECADVVERLILPKIVQYWSKRS